MKKMIFPVSIFFLIYGFSSPEMHNTKQEQDLISCIKKYRSQWGRTCSACKTDEKTFTVFLKNECTQAVDIKCAVQEAEKRWRTFVRLNMLPGDSISAYACSGTGKYLYWARIAGDKSTPFPEDEEINQQHSK